MGLSFTAQQIQTMSSDLLKLPGKINAPGTGLIAQKAAYAALAPGLLATDGNQKVFSDSWISAIAAYHAELALLNLEQRTNYSDASITAAAQGTKGAGTHYPTSPPWTSLTPALLPANTGNPSSTATGPSESDAISSFLNQINPLTSGFSDGSASFSGTLRGNTISVDGDISGLAIGNRLYVAMTGGGFFATVSAINVVTGGSGGSGGSGSSGGTSDTTNVVCTITSGTPADGPVNAQNNFPGFSNAQRSGTASLGYYSGAYAVLRDQFKAAVTAWQTNLTAQQTALSGNPDIANGAHVSAALQNVATALQGAATWQALPDLAPNGLLSDTGLTNLQSDASARQTQIPLRVTQIHADLGSVTQNSDGSYSGSGAYLALFKLVDMRAALGVGTLTKYYDNLRNQGLFDKQIAADNNQIAQYQTIMNVSQILADTIVGQDTFAVDTVAGLSVGSQVSVMDNQSVTYTRTVSLISGTNVKLNSGIPIVLTVSNQARIVMLKQ